jgi:acyl carrier protein
MTRMDDFETEIRRFLADNFLFGEEKPLAVDESLLDAGLIDSTGVLELISHIEAHYRIKVEDEELIPENLDTIANICAFLKKKTS